MHNESLNGRIHFYHEQTKSETLRCLGRRIRLQESMVKSREYFPVLPGIKNVNSSFALGIKVMSKETQKVYNDLNL